MPALPKLITEPLALVGVLVPAAAKKLPALAVQVPIIALSKGLDALDQVSRTYGSLAQRGETILHGIRPHEAAGSAKSHLSVVADRVEDAVQTVTSTTSSLVDDLKGEIGEQAPATPAPTPVAEQPKAEQTPAAPKGAPVRHDTAVSAETSELVEAVADATLAPAVLAHDDLPLPDYDHLTLGSLRGRIRSLSLPQLVQVRDYEKAHADRLPVVTLFDNRIAKLATDASATPSPGGESPVLPSAPAAATPPVDTKPAAAGTPTTKVRTT